MANEKRLIDANAPLKQLSDYMEKLHCSDDYRDGLYRGMEIAESYIKNAPTVDAVEVVQCKDCRWAKPYKRNDGETGFYCNFCGHAFKYGPNWERLFTPVKDADDFCSYGERKEDE